MADDNTYSYMYSPKDVASSGNKYEVGAGPLPYAPPGVVQYGTYPEPPEGYNQYQVADGENIRSYDVGTGPQPNIGPGMIPRGYNVPPPPPLRTPERRITATPAPVPASIPTQSPSISQQYMNERKGYNKYVGHLDPNYYGSSFATPHERFAAGAQTGATQTAITEQFKARRMQQGGEQYDTLESYAMDKFNPIPQMDLLEFQDMMENDFGIGDPVRAAMATPLAPSVHAMQEEYDAGLPPQYGTPGNPYNLTEARQAANLQATGGAGYTPGAYSIQPQPQTPTPSVEDIRREDRGEDGPIFHFQGQIFNTEEDANKARQEVIGATNLQPQPQPQPPGAYSSPPESSKYSGQELQTAQEEIEKRRLYNEQYPGGMNTPSYSPITQQIVNDLNIGLVQGLNQVQQEEGGLTGDEVDPDTGFIDTGTNTVAGTVAGALGLVLGSSATAQVANAFISALTGQQDALSLNKSVNELLEFANLNYVPPVAEQQAQAAAQAAEQEAHAAIKGINTSVPGDIGIGTDSGIGPSPGPDVSPSTGEDVSGLGGKDGGEVRKYRDGSVEVGSIDPRISPSQGSSSPAMDFINKPGAAPPSELADDVLIKSAEGDVGVREGDVVFPPESVEVMGLLNMNDMMKAALGLALEVGAVVPADIDPNEKVPVKLTNGEVIVPKVVADALGKERVQEIINKGLKLRAQREEQAKAQQQAPQAAPQASPQAAPPAPQAAPQGLKDGTSSIGKQMDSLLQGAESIYKDVKKNPSKWGTAALTEIGDALGLSQDSDLDTRAREAWSSYHGAEPDLLKEAQFVLHQTGKDDPELRKVIQGTLKNYYTEKDGQIIGDKGLNPTTVEEIMMRIAAHETPGGETRQMIKEKGKLVPKGRARGRLQVEPTTARSMLTEAKELIGPKVQSSLEQTFGVPYNKIQTLSDKEFNNVLQNNPRASVEFGILNLITKLKRDKKLDLIR